MWSVAQFIESRRHRKTLQSLHGRHLRGGGAAARRCWTFSRACRSPLIVNAWYDDACAAALREAGRRDFVEIQGVTRAGVRGDIWTRTYDAEGAPCEDGAVDAARTALYSPHGGVRPARNFLVADSDYVEVLTEIDIQTPIPATVKARRAERGFLFLGCPFHDQMLRTYARQIMKRSKGPHFAVVEADALTRNEAKFFADQEIEIIDAPLAAAARRLSAETATTRALWRRGRLGRPPAAPRSRFSSLLRPP